MYWMAYSQYKLRKFNQTKDTIDKLLKTYQKTQWKDDAELLLAQLPGQVAVKVDPVTVSVGPVMGAPLAVKVDSFEGKIDPFEVSVQVPQTDEAQARVADGHDMK